MSRNIEVEGLDKLLSQLSSLAELKTIVKGSMDEGMQQAKDQAKSLSRVGDGALRESIGFKTEIDGDKVVGTLYANTDYAAYVELGTGIVGQNSPCEDREVIPGITYTQHPWTYTPDGGQTFYTTNGMEARPYLYPALKYNSDNIARIVKQDIEDEIRRRG